MCTGEDERGRILRHRHQSSVTEEINRGYHLSYFFAETDANTSRDTMRRKRLNVLCLSTCISGVLAHGKVEHSFSIGLRLHFS